MFLEVQRFLIAAHLKRNLPSTFKVCNNYCYIPRLSLSKTSIVIGWFLLTCPWSNSNVPIPIMIQLSSHCPRIARDQCMTKFKSMWSSTRANISLSFEFHSKEAKSQDLEQMLLLTFIIPSEFLFLIEIEIIKALFYYILAIAFSCTLKHL